MDRERLSQALIDLRRHTVENKLDELDQQDQQDHGYQHDAGLPSGVAVANGQIAQTAGTYAACDSSVWSIPT